MTKKRKNPVGDLNLPTLTKEEAMILHRAAQKVVRSIVKREKNPLRRRFLFYVADREAPYQSVLARMRFDDATVWARH